MLRLCLHFLLRLVRIDSTLLPYTTTTTHHGILR